MSARARAIQWRVQGQGFEQRSRFPVTAFIGLLALLIPMVGAAQLAASVLPGSRSVQVGSQATAFGALINTGSETAIDCSIEPITQVPAGFFFQTTDPATNQTTGTRDTPADIPTGTLQTYVFGFAATQAFEPVDVELLFDCTNTDPALTIPGVNTLLLSAADTLPPDIVALAATLANDGITNIPNATGTGVFSVATVNVGAGATVDVIAETFDAATSVNIALCETDPLTGACINPVVPTREAVTTNIASGATPTFGIFVQGQGDVAFDAIRNRTRVRFEDQDGTVRGATSVAIRSVLQLLNVEDLAATAIAQFGTDVDATMAVVLAIDNGYSLRQVVDAIVAGWLTRDGDVVNSGGLVAPAGPPLGVIIRDDAVSASVLADSMKRVKASQVSETSYEQELLALKKATLRVFFAHWIGIVTFQRDPNALAAELIDFLGRLIGAYEQLEAELRQKVVDGMLPICGNASTNVAALLVEETRTIAVAVDDPVICVPADFLEPEPPPPTESVYRGELQVTVTSLDPFSGRQYDTTQTTGLLELTVPANPQQGDTVGVLSDVDCRNVTLNCDNLTFQQACAMGSLAEYGTTAFVGSDVTRISMNMWSRVSLFANLGTDQISATANPTLGSNCFPGDLIWNISFTLTRQ